jgi:hypothetical protein
MEEELRVRCNEADVALHREEQLAFLRVACQQRSEQQCACVVHKK